ncbi:uncharacterized protein LOC129589373 [Paramacrobiotus metropolitanus]|uniref:uncharacterized protein LOC129589373 n=1 Tax=Paramacrobiotus metropolitanus TaxID=2943436 RepID=UPI0024460AE1|nr:uncharacterized protein LOC129589373 [Paramacrobiotus metropolitanus]
MMDDSSCEDDKKILADHFSKTLAPSWYTSSHSLARIMSSVFRLLHGTVEAKLLGLDYLCMILEGVPPDRLQKAGYLDVAFDSIMRLLLMKELRLLSPSYVAVRNLLLVIDSLDHESSTVPTKFGQLDKTDTVLVESLRNMELFTERSIRSGLLDETILLMDQIGLRCGKYLPRFLDLMDSLISMQILWQYSLALKLLRAVFQNCWPVCANHINRITLQVMKILLDKLVAEGTAIYEETCRLLQLCITVGNPEEIKAFAGNVLSRSHFSPCDIDKFGRAVHCSSDVLE